jgi:hypothetical protein
VGGVGARKYSQYRNSLQAGWSVDQILVGARFSAPVWTSPGTHPAAYTVGTSSLWGVKWLGHSVNHAPPSSAKVKESVHLYLYSPFVPSWQVIS